MTHTATAAAPSVRAGSPEARAQAATLVARTIDIADPGDLLAVGGRPDGVVWQRDDLGLAGVGAALRLALPDGIDGTAGVQDTLASVAAEGRAEGPGRGPVAIGALPFHREEPGELIVPRLMVGRDAGGAWLTTVAPAGEEVSLEALAGTPPEEPPDGFTLSSPIPHQAWRAMVEEAVDAIRAGKLGKVVLARRVDVAANRPFVVADVLDRLQALYPTCTVFHVDGFIGASPELLVERRGRQIRSLPLAGTVARSGDVDADERLVNALFDSLKERAEHRFVIDALTAALAPVCADLDIPERPTVLPLRNVSHLATSVTGRLRAVGDDVPSVLDLVARIHPTPAVGGTPSAEAAAYLRGVEGFPRRRYAGPVGWMDQRGDGAWALGIRSADVAGAHASIYAGVGVVEHSDPAAELTETQLKLQALLAALVRP